MNLPKKKYHSSGFSTLTYKWKLDDCLKALTDAGIEHTLGVDMVSEDNLLSFNIRFRSRDKRRVEKIIMELYSTLKQG